MGSNQAFTKHSSTKKIAAVARADDRKLCLCGSFRYLKQKQTNSAVNYCESQTQFLISQKRVCDLICDYFRSNALL